MRRALWPLALLLAACSVALTVNLPDQTLELPGLADTGERVAYPKDPLAFAPPALGVVRGLRVEGVLEASQPLSLTLEFYARTQDPGQDPDCRSPGLPFAPQGIGVEPTLYLCPIGPEDERVGEARFQNSRTTPFTLQGTRLAEGIRTGRLWLGIKASGLPSTPVTLIFRNMRAHVVLGL
ncbi:hypothetical protein [Thermus sediminis]|uniref:hypothetical protein n=1 Tax=Thermus sediminis TaxID=1761908 RepID=UPI000E3E2F87|nr:hypothetical protein [Thermus sediminis]